MRRFGVFAAVLLAVAPAFGAAAGADDVTILVRGNLIGASGGERPSVWMNTSPLTIGRTQHIGIARMPTTCGLAVGPDLAAGNVGGWTIDVTPQAVTGRAVTFRIAWERVGGDAAPRVESTLTLEPGESAPLDVLPFPAALRTRLGSGCDVQAASLRVSLEYGTSPEYDRRLLETDLWLVEHLPDGTDRSRHTQVRGQFNVPTSFYFDDLGAGNDAFDVSGEFVARQTSGATDVSLEIRRRPSVSAPNSVSHITRSVRLTPGDVAAVEFPALDIFGPAARASASTLAMRVASVNALSLRIQTKQIR